MTDNERIVREFLAAWSNLDPTELVGYFAEAGIYHNMPMEPVVGHEALHGFITAFLANWEKTDWEILNLLCQGDLVMVERMDRTVVQGKDVNLPCFGLFKMKDGKIAVWRDYFDMATYVDALA